MNDNEYKNDNYIVDNFNSDYQNDNLNYNTNYDQNNSNEYSDYDDNYQKYRKRKGILSAIAIGVLSFASLAGIGIGVYYLISQQKNNSIVLNNNTTNSQIDQYILGRSLSLQFLDENSQNDNKCIVSSGTGWIINKDKNDDSYYIATNLHVAAITTYAGHNIWDPEDNSIGYYGNSIQCLVGYMTNSNNNLNMITVEAPKIVYSTFMDSNWNYSSGTGVAYNGKTQKYQIESDFAILKYDFSESTLNNESVITKNPNNSKEISDFENWLNNYNNEPTMFLPNVIQDYDYKNLKFSMGGFPANASGTSNGISPNQNANYSNVEWEKFDDFSGDKYDDVFTNTNINIGDAYNVQNFSAQNPTSPIIYYNEKLTPESTNPWDGGYINGAYGFLLGASSEPGSSGSMLVTYTENQYYVVGIYWGSISSSDNKSKTYGAADIFNTNTNGNSNNGYNLIQLSYNYLTNSGDELYFNPVTNQKN